MYTYLSFAFSSLDSSPDVCWMTKWKARGWLQSWPSPRYYPIIRLVGTKKKKETPISQQVSVPGQALFSPTGGILTLSRPTVAQLVCVSKGRARCLIKEVPYLSGSFFALVGGGEDVELCATSGEGALVDVHSAQVNIDTTGPPARKKKRIRKNAKLFC